MAGRSEGTSAQDVRLGLRENWQQFSLLVLLNAFVGGMVGLERTVVPLIGSQEFRIASTTIVVSFIVSFGVVKAFANLISGHLADLYGRKHLLVAGRDPPLTRSSPHDHGSPVGSPLADCDDGKRRSRRRCVQAARERGQLLNR